MTVPASNVEPLTPPTFRRAIARWATGVAIVTAHDGERDYGLTVNSLTSITLEPPLVLISLGVAADTTPVIRRTGAFGASILTAHQRSLSERFAQTLEPRAKFDGVAVHRGAGNVPLLDGALATFECRVEREILAEDHVLVVGRVVSVFEGPDAIPLIFYRSRYVGGEDAHGQRLDVRGTA